MFRSFCALLLLVSQLALANKFETDGRRPLSDSYGPWGAVGKLWLPQGSCTATLVAPDLIVTAGHCVTDEKTHQIVRGNYRFQPQYVRGHAPFSATITQIAVGTLNDQDSTNDWALLRLNWRMGNQVGWMGVKAASYQEMLYLERQTAVYMAGYSADYENGEVPTWQSNCGIQDSTNGYFLHNCSGTHGASGSPIFIFVGDDGRIVAINVAQRDGGLTSQQGQIFARGVFNPMYANVAAPASSFMQRLVEMKHR